MQQASLRNLNFEIVKKIEQVTENKHKKCSQNFDWDILHPWYAAPRCGRINSLLFFTF